MKRQIIKTKPERPYRIARIVIAAVALLLLAVLAYALIAPHMHAPRTTVRQDLLIAPMNPRSPIILT